MNSYALIWSKHYNDVIMSAVASQITSLAIVYSNVYSGADQRKHQSSASLAFMGGIHRWRVNTPHKGTKGQYRGKYFHFMTSSWENRSNWSLLNAVGGLQYLRCICTKKDKGESYATNKRVSYSFKISIWKTKLLYVNLPSLCPYINHTSTHISKKQSGMTYKPKLHIVAWEPRTMASGGQGAAFTNMV